MKIKIPDKYGPQVNEGVVTCAVCLPPSLKEWCNDYYRTLGYKSRTDMIRSLIKDAQAKHCELDK